MGVGRPCGGPAERARIIEDQARPSRRWTGQRTRLAPGLRPELRETGLQCRERVLPGAVPAALHGGPRREVSHQLGQIPVDLDLERWRGFLAPGKRQRSIALGDVAPLRRPVRADDVDCRSRRPRHRWPARCGISRSTRRPPRRRVRARDGTRHESGRGRTSGPPARRRRDRRCRRAPAVARPAPPRTVPAHAVRHGRVGPGCRRQRSPPRSAPPAPPRPGRCPWRNRRRPCDRRSNRRRSRSVPPDRSDGSGDSRQPVARSGP